MKLLLAAVAILVVVLNSSAYADESQNDHCGLGGVEALREHLAAASGKRQVTEAAAQAAQFLTACRSSVFPTPISPKDQIKNFYGLVDKLLQAQLAIEKYDECINLGTATTDAWNSPAKSLADTTLRTSLQNTLASCKSRRDKVIAEKFSAEKCPLFAANHKYSSAVAVPERWRWKTKGPGCLYLYGGKNRAIPEEEGIRLRENSPHLILLQMEGDRLIEQYIDFQQGELASKELCLSGRIDGVDFLATGGKAKQPLIRIKSYAEHCLRDSASFAIDAVYQIERETALTATNELLISLQ